MISLADGNLLEGFPGSFSFDGCQFEKIACQRRPLQAVMNAPETSRSARFLDQGGVNQSHGNGNFKAALHATFFEQLTTESIKPALTLAQAFEHRDIGEIRQSSLAGSNRRFAQGATASQMNEKSSQQILFGFILPQSLQSVGAAGKITPVRRKERDEEIPVFLEKVAVFHGRHHSSQFQNTQRTS